MNIDKVRLKALAEQAIPGPWELNDQPTRFFWQILCGAKLVASVPTGGSKNSEKELSQRKATAEFICAATPGVVMGLIAEIESLRRESEASNAARAERQAAGIEKARAEGKYKGRPIDMDLHQRVRDLLSAGLGVRPTARQAGCSITTVIKIRNGMAKEASQ